jgi:hypothetical protein
MNGIDFPTDLLDDFAARRAAFFVGAGASAAVIGRDPKKHLLDWETFLIQAADCISDHSEKDFVISAIKNREFPLAAEVLKDALQEKWINLIEECYNPPAITPSELHKTIVCSHARLVITTHFDELLEKSAILNPSSNIESTILLDDANLMKKLRSDGRHIVKLHGTVVRPESIIFTKSEYNSKALYNEKYARYLESIFLNYTVVFAGTSMRDPMINFVLDSIASRFGKLRPHYIFDRAAHRSPDDRFRFEKRGLRLLQYGADGSGHADLPVQIAKLTRDAGVRMREKIGMTLSSL